MDEYGVVQPHGKEDRGPGCVIGGGRQRKRTDDRRSDTQTTDSQIIRQQTADNQKTDNETTDSQTTDIK